MNEGDNPWPDSVDQDNPRSFASEATFAVVARTRAASRIAPHVSASRITFLLLISCGDDSVCEEFLSEEGGICSGICDCGMKQST